MEPRRPTPPTDCPPISFISQSLAVADPRPPPLGGPGFGGVVPGGGAWGEVESAKEAAAHAATAPSPPPSTCRSPAVAPLDVTSVDGRNVHAVGSLTMLAR